MKIEADEEHAPRNKQLNLKVSEDCKEIFEIICKALDTNKADLFEDMVAERYEELVKQGAIKHG